MPSRKSAGHRHRRRVSGLAAALAVATATAVVPAAAAAAATTSVQPIAGFCGSTPAAFTDVSGDVHAAAIDCAAKVGIADGGPGSLPASRFGPSRLVTRAQMASFVARLLDAAGRAGAASGNSVQRLPSADAAMTGFTDVSRGDVHAEAIARLAQAGVVSGGPGALASNQYGPSQTVDRAQMASMLNRAVGFLIGTPWTANTNYFTDDAHSVHQADINALAAHGVTVGTGTGRFQPQQPVSRDQMASFLIRTLAALHAQGVIGDAAAAAVPAPTTGALSACSGSQLLTSASPVSGALGHVGLVIEIRNVSRQGCTLAGYPGANVITASGNSVTAQRTLHGYLGGVSPSASTYPTVKLQPGDTASAVLEGTDVPSGGQTQCPVGKELRTTPPGTTATVTLDKAPPACQLQIHPVLAGTTGRTGQ